MSTVTTEKGLLLIQPDWPAPPHVKAYQTTRHEDFSQAKNTDFSPPPFWLNQVHGNQVVKLEGKPDQSFEPEADASFSTQPLTVCAVRTADCLPILLCDRQGTCVSAIHAGWRSLLAGIIELTIAALPVKSEELLAWFGPAIGPEQFEIGEDVYSLFINIHEEAKACFKARKHQKFLANLYQLAKQRLSDCGVKEIYGGNYCTYSQEDLFFSYRRDGTQTGRMASLIWLKHKDENTNE